MSKRTRTHSLDSSPETPGQKKARSDTDNDGSGRPTSTSPSPSPAPEQPPEVVTKTPKTNAERLGELLNKT